MKIAIELFLYCLLFTALVKYAVRGGAAEALYFYPKAVQERAVEIGLTDRETISKRRRAFMPLLFGVMLAALLLIIGLWNGVHDFKTAYLQALLFLEVMNWFDGVVIDRLWVGHDPFWVLPGTQDIPFVQTWPQVLKKRCVLTLIWLVGAALVAGLVVLIFGVLIPKF